MDREGEGERVKDKEAIMPPPHGCSGVYVLAIVGVVGLATKHDFHLLLRPAATTKRSMRIENDASNMQVELWKMPQGLISASSLIPMVSAGVTSPDV